MCVSDMCWSHACRKKLYYYESNYQCIQKISSGFVTCCEVSRAFFFLSHVARKFLSTIFVCIYRERWRHYLFYQRNVKKESKKTVIQSGIYREIKRNPPSGVVATAVHCGYRNKGASQQEVLACMSFPPIAIEKVLETVLYSSTPTQNNNK